MKSACNWTVWESNDGLVKRIYVAKDECLENGDKFGVGVKFGYLEDVDEE